MAGLVGAHAFARMRSNKLGCVEYNGSNGAIGKLHVCMVGIGEGRRRSVIVRRQPPAADSSPAARWSDASDAARSDRL